MTVTSYRTSEYRAMTEEIAPRLDALERVIYFDTEDWTARLEAGDAVDDDALRSRSASLDPLDPINIQYTSTLRTGIMAHHPAPSTR